MNINGVSCPDDSGCRPGSYYGKMAHIIGATLKRESRIYGSQLGGAVILG